MNSIFPFHFVFHRSHFCCRKQETAYSNNNIEARNTLIDSFVKKKSTLQIDIFPDNLLEVLFFPCLAKSDTVLCTLFQSPGKVHLFLLAFQGFTIAQVI